MSSGNFDSGTGMCGVPANAALNVRNTIARGSSADVGVDGSSIDGCTSSSSMDIDYSNYSTITMAAFPVFATKTEGPNNQKSAAQTSNNAIFAAFSFQQRPDSPTVNAGTADSKLGSADIDGDLGPSGPAPDIGADEYPVAPGVTTGPVDVGVSDALVTATVSSPSATRVHF